MGDSDDFGIYLENPKRRRRRSRRRSARSSRRRRRRNPATYPFAPNPRRRRRGGRRRRSSGRRRNPAGFFGGGGGIMRTVNEGFGIFAAELAGDLVVRGINKFVGLQRWLPAALAGQAPSVVRILVGLAADPLLRMVGIREGFRRQIAAVNIASGIIGLTYPLRQQTFAAVGLSGLADYETIGQDEEDHYGLLGDYETVGAYEGEASGYYV
jgi:hypothetical protein